MGTLVANHGAGVASITGDTGVQPVATVLIDHYLAEAACMWFGHAVAPSVVNGSRGGFVNL